MKRLDLQAIIRLAIEWTKRCNFTKQVHIKIANF